MTSALLFEKLSLAAFSSVTNEERQIWIGFSVRHLTGAATANQTHAAKASLRLHQQHPQGGRHRRLSEHCHVVSAEITLISLRGMSLAVLGRKQSGMEVGRGWRKCGRGDIAVEGGGGGRRSGMGGGGGVCASETTGICIPLSSVTGWERWRNRGATHSGGFGRTVAEVQESKKQCYKILPSLLAVWPLWPGTGILK